MAANPRLEPVQPPRVPLLPIGFDWLVFGALVSGLFLIYGPAYLDLARTIWASDEQGHGPIILAVSIWLLYQSDMTWPKHRLGPCRCLDGH